MHVLKAYVLRIDIDDFDAHCFEGFEPTITLYLHHLCLLFVLFARFRDANDLEKLSEELLESFIVNFPSL